MSVSVSFELIIPLRRARLVAVGVRTVVRLYGRDEWGVCVCETLMGKRCGQVSGY